MGKFLKDIILASFFGTIFQYYGIHFLEIYIPKDRLVAFYKNFFSEDYKQYYTLIIWIISILIFYLIIVIFSKLNKYLKTKLYVFDRNIEDIGWKWKYGEYPNINNPDNVYKINNLKAICPKCKNDLVRGDYVYYKESFNYKCTVKPCDFVIQLKTSEHESVEDRIIKQINKYRKSYFWFKRLFVKYKK